MRIFSTFTGIGGFEIGIEKAFLSSTARSENPTLRMEGNNSDTEQKSMGVEQPTCVGYSEIDKYAIKVYERQFGGINESISNQTSQVLQGDCLELMKDIPDQKYFEIAKKRIEEAEL